MQFNYQARTKNGLIQVGVVEVASRKDAVSLLQKEGLFVTHIEEITPRPFYLKQLDLLNKAGRKDIMMFCRELALMLKSGVGLVESLKALADQTTKSVFREQILEVSADVEGGVYFSEALARYPKVFSNFFINIIKAGEASGKLSESLSYLALHLEREYNLVNKIKSGMTYPAFILVAFLGIGALGIFMVLPSFKETLSSLEVELPVLTQMVLGFGDWVRRWWWLCIIIVVVAVILISRYFKTQEGKEIIGKIALRIPLLGKTIRKVYLTRFTENLSTLILAGLPITQALDIVSGATGNKTYQKIILETQDGVRRGETMSAVLEKHPKDIPGLVTQMIKVGERTGRLDESLMNVANFYESEVNRNIDALVDIIEPLLIVILGGLVALLMVSIIVPVKNQGDLLENFLKSVDKLNYPKGKIEVIIADGRSTDNTRKTALEYGAKVVDNPKQTVGPGRNIAFKKARGEIIAFSDADCLVDKNWLKNSLKYFSNPKIAGVGGPNLTPRTETDFGKAVGFFMNQAVFSAGSIHGRNLPFVSEVKSLPGCNSIYRRSVLEKVMPIDESLLTCDDTELNLRIGDLGYKLLSVPDVFVWHYQRPTPKKLWQKMYRWAIGRLQLGKKRKDGINLVHIGAGLSLPFFIIVSLFLLLINPFLSLYLIGLFFLSLLILFFFALIKIKSIKVALRLPLVIIIVILAWSLGFLKEFLFPFKNPAGC